MYPWSYFQPGGMAPTEMMMASGHSIVMTFGAPHDVQSRRTFTQAGVKVRLDCTSCGAPNVMTIEWPEAIIISVGAIPPGWKYDQGYIRPEIGCAQCRRLLSPGVTPSEAERWVKAGINARFVNPQQAQAIATKARGG